MKPEFIVDRELIEQMLVIVFGPSAQYLTHEPRDADSYTIQVRTSLGKYRFVVHKETLFNTLHNKLTQDEADQVRQQILLADSDPVIIHAMKKNMEPSVQSTRGTEVPKKRSGCLGRLLLMVLLILVCAIFNILTIHLK
ncbi:hypothetical protein [Larkinella rosea]|uniref:Uncharacterized protein n=1 Tax=Larkinella rosea TaxID=2025312 RepID=A0A3P1C4K0_9BACT|nr:hypothetical protein [Larkinella rosea]RRB07844.1 hypothetical protein EHT25_08730 [Larkinella rosea]